MVTQPVRGIRSIYNDTATTGSYADINDIVKYMYAGSANMNTTDTTSFTWGTTTYTLSPLRYNHEENKIPTFEEFDFDYGKDTQETEDPLKIMKRIARGCYKGNSCVKCNNERIEKEYQEKYGSIAYMFDNATTVAWTPYLSPTVTWTTTNTAGGQ